eukprot:TRINITY_DN4979_c0_g11_i1.p1 TRINITY_DN4979_c0_g11~~TRINITY_DN4979_c0_g11_i1.p1  ORF type:complete len:342 (-),score=93.16 TRINITY_DN4979_c0_g11_i1:187-1212(-)
MSYEYSIVILGSAQDGSLPQFGSNNKNDVRARKEKKFRRTAASIVIIEKKTGKTIIVDPSPDLPIQHETLLKNNSDYTNKYRRQYYNIKNNDNNDNNENENEENKNQNEDKVHPIFDGIILTHAHIGHYAGLIHFGREVANTHLVNCWSTLSMTNFLKNNAPWSMLFSLNNINPIIINEKSDEEEEEEEEEKEEEYSFTFHLFDGKLKIRGILVPHRGEFTDTIGVSINDKILYIPDIDNFSIKPHVLVEIKKHEINILDGSFFDKSEVLGINRDPEEIPHPFIRDSIEMFTSSNIKTDDNRIIFTHFNHSNPVVDIDSDQHQYILNNGFEAAYDGMIFNI